MKRSKIICIFLTIALLLSACSVIGENIPNTESGENTFEQQSSSPPQETNTTPSQPAETTPLTTTAEETTSETAANPIPPNEYTDEKGFLTEKGIASIDRILNDNKAETGSTYTGLFDFDGDNIPEVYLVYHNGGQGLMPVEVFDLEGKRLGEFQGYCRDGYTKLNRLGDTVYVNNFYENSVPQRLNRMDKLTLSDGELHTELYYEAYAEAVDNFPVLETVYYYKDGEERRRSDPEEQEREWDYRFLYDDIYVYSNVEGGVSVCACDFSDRVSFEEMAEETAKLYNLYIKGKAESLELFKADPDVDTDLLGENIFVFDDFDGDGNYEAFSYVKGGNHIYFWNGELFEKIEAYGHIGQRLGNMFIFQPFAGSANCHIFGVENGKCFKTDISDIGMWTDNMRAPEVGTFFLFRSRYDANSAGGGHTWKPFLFNISGEEIEGIPVERSEFAALKQGEALSAELERLENEGFTVCEIYRFSDKYYVVNYFESTYGENENGEWVRYVDRNFYNWYLAWNSFEMIIEKGQGRYTGGSIREQPKLVYD